MIDQVLKENNLEGQIRAKTTNALESTTFGLKWFQNATVLLPDYLNINSFDELRAVHINRLLKQAFGFEVGKEDWATPEGRSVIESFMLSDSAKKFLIARDIHSLRTSERAYDFAVAALFVNIALMIQSRYRDKMKVMISKKMKNKFFGSKNPVIQFWLFSVPVAALISYMFYALIQVQIQRDADAMALTKGCKDSDTIHKTSFSESNVFDVSYYLGAKEYYLKVLERNRAMRNIIDRDPNISFYKKVLSLGLFSRKGDEMAGGFGVRLSTSARLNNVNEWEKA